MFDQIMEGINLEKYLTNLTYNQKGRIRYNPVDMLKTVLFGFMIYGYISLRELGLCEKFSVKTDLL